MIPLKDTVRSRIFPIVNWLLIAVLALVFLFEITLPPEEYERLIFQYGLVPARIDWQQPWTLVTFITSMFLHGGWFHFLSNAWILYIFGDNVEDRLGSGRYLVFYLLGGIAAGVIQYTVAPDSQVPTIGASGAIAAVLGAYFLYFPTARVITLIPLFIFPWLVEVPSVVFLGIWFVSQLFSGLISLGSAGMEVGGIAWWAHIGGFVFGLGAARLFAARRTPQRWYPDQYWPW
jgi:membrane associated rhomboid family serine protease